MYVGLGRESEDEKSYGWTPTHSESGSKPHLLWHGMTFVLVVLFCHRQEVVVHVGEIDNEADHAADEDASEDQAETSQDMW